MAHELAVREDSMAKWNVDTGPIKAGKLKISPVAEATQAAAE